MSMGTLATSSGFIYAAGNLIYQCDWGWEEEGWQNQPEASFRIDYKGQGLSGAEKHETGLKNHFMVGKSWGNYGTKAAIAPEGHFFLTCRCPTSWTAVKVTICLHQGRETTDPGLWPWVTGEKCVPVVKARNRRYSFKEIQKVLCAGCRKVRILNAKSITYF